MFYIALTLIIIALLSLWVKKTTWVWGFLAALSLILTQKSGQLLIIAFIPLAITTFLFFILQWNLQGLSRFVLASAAIIVSGALFSCLLPGFPHCFNLYSVPIHYGKIAAALPILAWSLPLLAEKKDWCSFFTTHFWLSVLGACLLIAFSFYTSFSIPSLSLFKSSLTMILWLPLYLFCVIIPEEALLRGFLQKELFQWTGQGIVGHIITISVSTTIFSFFHLGWISDLSLLGITFLMGTIYGILYQLTRKIETCIFCRLMTCCFYFYILPTEGIV